MKESLALLNVNSSGIREFTTGTTKSNDEDVFNQANSISDLAEKEIFLKQELKSKPGNYVKSMRLLVDLVKEKEPNYACELNLHVTQYNPFDPENYLKLAEVAYLHNALNVSNSLLNVARWLSFDKYENFMKEVNLLEKNIQEKVKAGIKDVSDTDLWRNKSANKHWVLERFYYRCDVSKVLEYAFRLLDLYPDDSSNYMAVFWVFSIDDESMKMFLDELNLKSYIRDDIKDLYLGLIHHNLLNIETSVSHLEKVLEKDSKNNLALVYLALNYFCTNNIVKYSEVIKKIKVQPDLISVASYFIYCAMSNVKLEEIEFPNQKGISIEIAKIISRTIDLKNEVVVDCLINQFIKLNFTKILPNLIPQTVEIFIQRNNTAIAKQLLKFTDSNESLRLNAWISRIEGNEELAEKLLVDFRKSWMADKDSGIYCQLVNLKYPEVMPEKIEDIFSFVSDVYEQAKAQVIKIEKEYGLNDYTCVEVKCQDCCKYTYPYITYVEYLYIRNYLENNSKELLDSISEYSKTVVKDYEKRFNRKPPFLNKLSKNEPSNPYPKDFIFDCPFLGDNKCNIYTHRPFTCRTYAYGSADGGMYKGCNYYYEQFKSSTQLNNIRKVISMMPFYDYVGEIDIKLVGIKVAAPIPVWFAQSHEETLKLLSEIKS